MTADIDEDIYKAYKHDTDDKGYNEADGLEKENVGEGDYQNQQSQGTKQWYVHRSYIKMTRQLFDIRNASSMYYIRMATMTVQRWQPPKCDITIDFNELCFLNNPFF